MLKHNSKMKIEGSKVNQTKLFALVSATGLVLFLFFLGCNSANTKSEQTRKPANSGDRKYTVSGQSLILHELEYVPDGEAASLIETNNVIKQYFQKMYLSKGPQKDNASGLVTNGTRRGVHPKAHGCLLGRMKINYDISQYDQVGIFRPGAEYPIFARFSNGNPRPNGIDKDADSRGFAFKVQNVPGSPLLPHIAGADSEFTQDFTLNSTSTFFADSAETYGKFMRIGLLETQNFAEAATTFVKSVIFKDFHPLLATRIAIAFKKIQGVKVTNPLGIPYYSISAFQHGASTTAPLVKYSVMPCRGPWQEDDVDTSRPNFLRENLRKHMKAKGACFSFMIQNRDETFLVEDLTEPWSEDMIPFHEVARIEFPPQEFVDEAKCEAAVINPWNTLPEHKPVGGINRVRLSSYLMSIEARKMTNK